MKAFPAARDSRGLRPWPALSVPADAPWPMVAPRAAVRVRSGEVDAQSQALSIVQSLGTAAARALPIDESHSLKGAHNRSFRIRRSLPPAHTWPRLGTACALRRHLYNQAVDTDAQVRPAAARPCVLVRRSPLRYTDVPLI
jgi:hypothetical protein